MSGARYRLVPHALLRDAEGESLVVLPERAVKLNPTAREILSLCDGSRTAGEVVAELARRHEDAGEDARSFLDQMERLGVLERLG